MENHQTNSNDLVAFYFSLFSIFFYFVDSPNSRSSAMPSAQVSRANNQRKPSQVVFKKFVSKYFCWTSVLSRFTSILTEIKCGAWDFSIFDILDSNMYISFYQQAVLEYYERYLERITYIDIGRYTGIEAFV